MSQTIANYPAPWNFIAYAILGIGWVATVGFLARYMTRRPWYGSEIGRHLVAFSMSVGAFFTLYLVLALLPNLPGKGVIRLVLLVSIVAVSVWRWVLFERDERQLQRERRQ